MGKEDLTETSPVKKHKLLVLDKQKHDRLLVRDTVSEQQCGARQVRRVSLHDTTATGLMLSPNFPLSSPQMLVHLRSLFFAEAKARLMLSPSKHRGCFPTQAQKQDF